MALKAILADGTWGYRGKLVVKEGRILEISSIEECPASNDCMEAQRMDCLGYLIKTRYYEDNAFTFITSCPDKIRSFYRDPEFLVTPW